MTTSNLLTDKYQVKRATAFEEVEEVWRGLEVNSPISVYQRYDWVTTWYQKLIQDSGRFDKQQLQLIHIYKDRQIVAILPFSLRDRKGFRSLNWLGDEHYNYLGGIYLEEFLQECDETAFLAIWDQVLKELPHFHVLCLAHQALDIGQYKSPFRWFKHYPGANSSHQLIFPHHDWPTLLAELRSKSTRKRMRNEESRLSREGNLSSKRVTEPGELEYYTNILFEQRESRLKALGIKQENNIEAYRDFYLTLLKGSLLREDELAYLMVLELDDEVLASIIVAQTDNKLYLLINSMTSSRFKQWSPGDYLLRLVIQAACEQEAVLIDFGLGEDSNYKTVWCNHTISMFETIQGQGLIGKLIALVLGGKVRLKRRIKQTPRFWRWYTQLRMWPQSKNKWQDLKKLIKS